MSRFSSFSLIAKLTLAILASMLCATVSARHILGWVIGADTRQPLKGVRVELLSAADSTVVGSAITTENNYWYGNTPMYQIDVTNHTSYILRFSMVGYTTLYRPVKVEMADRVNEQVIDAVKMEPAATMLDEVTVTATKIKMVMHGDTLVYNASAFKLSQGSMLDALIRQLPGATLQDGLIKVNGRTVSSLLIDGRDFFKGDAKKALENLPAYTVDKIKAYDKLGQDSRLMGRDMNDRTFVLDVSLKKQYHQGLIGNADMAGGTDRRYNGKLFAMRYTKRSRLTVTAAANNMNDRGTPGEDVDMETAPDTGGGLTDTKSGTLTYRYEGAGEDNYIECTTALSRSDNETTQRITSQNFLTGGDHYGLAQSTNRNKNTAWNTGLYFSLTPGQHMLSGNSSINISKGNGWSNSRSARLNAKPSAIATLDSLFMPKSGQRLLAMTINRVRNDRLFQTNTLSYDADLTDRIAFGKDKENSWNNMLTMRASANYERTNNDSHALNHIDYMAAQGTNDHRRQYEETPIHNYSIDANIDYTRLINMDTTNTASIYIRPSYQFRQTYSDTDHSLYRLDQLAHYTDSAYALGVLPSTREALTSALDRMNSYRNRTRNVEHTASMTFNYNHGDGTRRPQYVVELTLPIRERYEKIEYYRNKSYSKERHSLLFEPTLNFTYHFNDSTGLRLASVTYSTNQQQPSLTSMLDIRDDANPLIVTLGNEHLKKSRTHGLFMMAAIFNMASQRNYSVSMNASIIQNAIATANVYDKATGITTTRPVNINGNWNAGAAVQTTTPIDRRKRITLEEAFSANYSNSVDLTTVKGTNIGRSEVHNWTLANNLNVSYQLSDNLRAELKTAITHQRATSDRNDFQAVSAWDCNVGLSGSIKLPWGMECATSIVDYIRRGYNDPQMNTNETVWNMRLTKQFMNDKLALSIDGFDILGNLSNNMFTLDAQGRTETWTNSLNRFFMIRAAYKFTFGMEKPSNTIF